MTRAVAVTSPQQPWNSGNELYPRLKNIGVAESVANTVQMKMAESGRRSFSEGEIEGMGKSAPGQGLTLGKGRAARAFAVPGETSQPAPGAENQDKVKNFNESLLVGRTSPVGRTATPDEVPRRLAAAYAGSSTQDVWHLRGRGYDSDTFHGQKGTYGVEKMLETRASFKSGESFRPTSKRRRRVGGERVRPSGSQPSHRKSTNRIIPQGQQPSVPGQTPKYEAHPSLLTVAVLATRGQQCLL